MKKRLFLRASNYMFSLQNRIKRLKLKNVKEWYSKNFYKNQLYSYYKFKKPYKKWILNFNYWLKIKLFKYEWLKICYLIIF